MSIFWEYDHAARALTAYVSTGPNTKRSVACIGDDLGWYVYQESPLHPTRGNAHSQDEAREIILSILEIQLAHRK